MKKILSCFAVSLVAFFNAQQTTIWSENFNTEDISAWTIINANGDTSEFGDITWATSQFRNPDFSPMDTPFLYGGSYTTYHNMGHLNPDD
ncbi:hypothetical protein NAL32_02880 [Chryseobacterium sp. Ch-15]|uniref:Uncharacterized protein n=1 Tax=Chryseobacterium muglaense TaxID=2893752 RepID=A0A9Q3YSJ9_9FLAO|nr:hypothetical protein [Chryseobacterium muglaense]MBD3903265.1 hypothetical protein [Chryseobacterium muglaense]MCC9036096.1 hypothetical protein [Chryseobacterium muglaense]MCM2553328.1 hypothetical protein [Chryseobacterium muglaense]